jgi:hypothetical protein
MFVCLFKATQAIFVYLAAFNNTGDMAKNLRRYA